MKTQLLTTALLVSILAFSAKAQENCQNILKKATTAYNKGDGDLSKAFDYLQDLEICDIHNVFQKQRQDLQKKIFRAIKEQKTIAEDARLQADQDRSRAFRLERQARESERAVQKEKEKAEQNAIRDSLLILYFEADPSKLSSIEKISYLENIVTASHGRYSKTLEFCHFELASIYESIGFNELNRVNELIRVNGGDTLTDNQNIPEFKKAEDYYKSLLPIAGPSRELNIYERLATHYKRRNKTKELKDIERLIGGNIEDVFAFHLLQTEEGKIKINDSLYTVTFEQKNSGVIFPGKMTIRDAFQKDLASFEQVLSPANMKLIDLLADHIPPFDRITTADNNSYIAYGIAGWSVGWDHTKNNDLLKLLLLFKDLYPEAFEQYFGRYGLDVNMEEEYLILAGIRLNTASQKMALRSPAWAFIFYRAAQDIRMQVTQLLLVFQQFDYLLNNEIITSQIITSDYGRSLFIAEYIEKNGGGDKFFNTPFYSYDDKKIQLAVTEVISESGKHFSVWSFDDEQTLLVKIKNVFQGKLSKQILADKTFITSKVRLFHGGNYCEGLVDISDKVKAESASLSANVLRKFCVVLDAAHGGINFQGEHVTAPTKQFEHAKGTFHKRKWFYEGVFNRHVTYRVAQTLKSLGIQYTIVNQFFDDTPLSDRMKTADDLCNMNYQCIYLGNHANASGLGTTRGTEVYTTPGRDQSDKLADFHWKNLTALFGNKINSRPDYSDGDPDREANFYMLRNTKMPAILIEHLFFDNYEDALLLIDDNIINLFVEVQVKTILDYMKSIE